jgi:hypothetical protein
LQFQTIVSITDDNGDEVAIPPKDQRPISFFNNDTYDLRRLAMIGQLADFVDRSGRCLLPKGAIDDTTSGDIMFLSEGRDLPMLPPPHAPSRENDVLDKLQLLLTQNSTTAVAQPPPPSDQDLLHRVQAMLPTTVPKPAPVAPSKETAINAATEASSHADAITAAVATALVPIQAQLTSVEKFNDGLHSELASWTSNFNEQLKNVRPDLARAPAHQHAIANRGYLASKGAGGKGPGGRLQYGGRPKVNVTPQPPHYNDDKPATQYDDISQPGVRNMLSSVNVHNKDDWAKRAEELCELKCCSSRRPHRLNRCTEVWHGTAAGQAYAGTVKADLRVQRALNDCATVQELMAVLGEVIDEDHRDLVLDTCDMVCCQYHITNDMPSDRLGDALSYWAAA